RRLARAGGADEHRDLVCRDDEVEVHDGVRAAGEPLGHPPQLDHAAGRGRGRAWQGMATRLLRTGDTRHDEREHGRMPTYVAFLRAVKLGATRTFPKDAIRACVEELGFDDVATYINTGNVRLRTTLRSHARVEAALEAAFRADRGFDVPVIAYRTD